MMSKNDLIVLSLLGLGIFCFYTYIYDGTENVQSDIDNNYYKVRRGPDKKHKANLLAIMNIKLNLIVENLDTQYKSNEPVQRLVQNWRDGVRIKETGKLEADAAYVINKKYMSFCIPDNVADSIDTLNLMTYVCIHELAHIMSIETGHGSEFIQNFQFLLTYAKTLKYLDPFTNKYQPVYIALNKLNTPDNYCGVSLNNSIN